GEWRQSFGTGGLLLLRSGGHHRGGQQALQQISTLHALTILHLRSLFRSAPSRRGTLLRQRERDKPVASSVLTPLATEGSDYDVLSALHLVHRRLGVY